MPKNKRHNPRSFGDHVAADNRITRFTCHNESSLTSSAGGTILAAISMDPSASADFAEFAAVYDEFRVLGAQLNLVAYQPNSTTINGGIVAIAYDNDSSAAPTAFTNVRQYGTSSVFSAILKHDQGKPYTVTYWRPTTGVAPLWIDCAVPAGSLGSIQIAVSGLTINTQYWLYAIDYFIEFRGRR
jgi:hypothetical protein